MKRLEWTPDLDTGIAVIDAQHQQIVDYINQLFVAQLAGDTKSVAAVLDATVDYTISHCSFEEALMEEAGYEFLGPHRKVHKLFENRILDFQQRFRSGEDVADELQGVLARWLFSHIRHDDASYVAAVKKQMLVITREKQEGGWLSRSVKRFFGG